MGLGFVKNGRITELVMMSRVLEWLCDYGNFAQAFVVLAFFIAIIILIITNTK